MAKRKSSLTALAAAMELDLKPFINYLILLSAVLVYNVEFSHLAIINIKLPEGRGSQTESAQINRPQEDDSDKLLLTLLVTDSVVTIGAKSSFLPSLMYSEYHRYVSKTDRTNAVFVEYDPKNPNKQVINPKTNKPFSIAERHDIELYVKDERGQIIKTMYTKNHEMVTNLAYKPIQEINAGDTVLTVTNPRRLMIVNNPADFTLENLSAYDEMRNRLLQVKERYREAADADAVIIAAENQVAYDKIVQLMDVARAADFPNISIAKLRSS